MPIKLDWFELSSLLANMEQHVNQSRSWLKVDVFSFDGAKLTAPPANSLCAKLNWLFHLSLDKMADQQEPGEHMES